MKEVSIFIVSDSVGETAQKVISAVMAQFPDVEETNIKRYPFITTEEDLKVILRDALNERAIVVATLVNKDLVQSLADFSSKTGLDYVDYMTPLTKLVQGKTGLTPQKTGCIT